MLKTVINPLACRIISGWTVQNLMKSLIDLLDLDMAMRPDMSHLLLPDTKQ